MKRLKNLMPRVTDRDNLRLAYAKTARGKRQSWGFLEFKEYEDANLRLIQEELRDGAYRLGEYRQFEIREPKPRLISALGFKDRLVQHALMNVIAAPFDRLLLPYTFACRTGLGTHAGVRHLQSRLRQGRATHYLQTDFRAYFASIDRAILHRLYARTIGCQWTLDVLARIVPTTGRGLPIGSLTSQHAANLYANDLDRFIHFDLKPLGWARYMDDMIVLGDDADALHEHRHRLEALAEQTRGLAFSRWKVAPVSRGIDFLGYRLWPRHKLLRKRSVARAKQRIRRDLAHGASDRLARFLPAWIGHATWADTHHLIRWLEDRYAITC